MKLLKQEIMKVYTRLLLTILVVSTFTAAYAQEDAEAFNKHDNLYISFDAGTSSGGHPIFTLLEAVTYSWVLCTNELCKSGFQ